VQPQQKGRKTICKNDGPNDNEQPVEARSLLVSYVPPIPTQYNGPERRKDNTPRWKKRAELTALFTAVLLLVVNVFIGWGNWRAAGAAKSSADTASKTLLISEQAHITIGRSDGTVAEIVMPNNPKDKAGILVYFQNSGHVPAKFNWGNDSPIIAILPTDPNAIKESQYTSQWSDFSTDHYFRPMWRARNRNTGGFGWSGTITIAGNSAYEGILWEVPKERMLQLMKWDRPFMPAGKFDYCDGFGHHLCRTFSILYVREPYNRFILVGEEECAIWEYQVLNPDPNFDYRPACELTEEREELRGSHSRSLKL
jgi:hypothetical protein